MFCIYPELLVSRLFTTVLNDNEVSCSVGDVIHNQILTSVLKCCIITGAERYSSYSGYSDSFTFEGNFNDKTLR